MERAKVGLGLGLNFIFLSFLRDRGILIRFYGLFYGYDGIKSSFSVSTFLEQPARAKYRKFLKVTGEALFFYGLLGWIYGVLIQLIHEPILRMQLSHLVP